MEIVLRIIRSYLFSGRTQDHNLVGAYIPLFSRLCSQFGRNAVTESVSISRVLSPASAGDGHFARTPVASRLMHPTRELSGPPHRSPIRACSKQGLASRYVTTPLVGSYPTFSPLPMTPAKSGHGRLPRAVSFLCHFPSDHSAWALPSALPSGARTFLR